MKFSVDWFAVAPGEIYPRMFRAGDDCPPALADDAERAGVLAPSRAEYLARVLAEGAMTQAEEKPRRKGRQ